MSQSTKIRPAYALYHGQSYPYVEIKRHSIKDGQLHFTINWQSRSYTPKEAKEAIRLSRHFKKQIKNKAISVDMVKCGLVKKTEKIFVNGRITKILIHWEPTIVHEECLLLQPDGSLHPLEKNYRINRKLTMHPPKMQNSNEIMRKINANQQKRRDCPKKNSSLLQHKKVPQKSETSLKTHYTSTLTGTSQGNSLSSEQMRMLGNELILIADRFEVDKHKKIDVIKAKQLYEDAEKEREKLEDTRTALRELIGSLQPHQKANILQIFVDAENKAEEFRSKYEAKLRDFTNSLIATKRICEETFYNYFRM